MASDDFLRDVVDRGLQEVRKRDIRIYTIALYHDHESAAVSVCVDTRDNSERVALEINAYNTKHFRRAIEAGDLDKAVLWQAGPGRSLSLGDFSAVNLARTDLPRGLVFWRQPKINQLAMVRALMAHEGDIRALSLDPKQTILACSGPEDEVALLWSLSESPPN